MTCPQMAPNFLLEDSTELLGRCPLVSLTKQMLGMQKQKISRKKTQKTYFSSEELVTHQVALKKQ